MDNQPPKRRLVSPENARALAKFSGMAFQMGLIIVLGVLGGQKVDAWLDTGKIFTMIISIISVGLAMYLPLKGLMNPKDKK